MVPAWSLHVKEIPKT